MKTLLFALTLALPAFSAQQTPPPACQQINCYTATTGNVALTAQATAATIQQPASCAPGACQQIYGVKATVYCSVACVVTRITGGTPATATAGTIVQSPARPSGIAAPLAQFFTASNHSGGTTIDTTNVNGTTQVYDLTDVVIGTTPGASYTIAVASITGTANITFYVGLK